MTTETINSACQAIVPSRSVRSRYSISGRTLSRWRHNADLGFPAAIMINGRCYFDEAQLLAWERSRVRTVKGATL